HYRKSWTRTSASLAVAVAAMRRFSVARVLVGGVAGCAARLPGRGLVEEAVAGRRGCPRAHGADDPFARHVHGALGHVPRLDRQRDDVDPRRRVDLVAVPSDEILDVRVEDVLYGRLGPRLDLREKVSGGPNVVKAVANILDRKSTRLN